MNTRNYERKDIVFTSGNDQCSAWLYLPNKVNCPVIVMAHGLGGTKDMRLDVYAQRFTEAGYACFLFDYRNMGSSGGSIRQRINVKEQLEDWDMAIEYVKNIIHVDSKKIILFGSSFSGGHVIKESSKHPEIVATISQCPYTDTFATLSVISLKTQLKLMWKCTLDILSSLIGRDPVMVSLAAAPNQTALMAVKDYQLCIDMGSLSSTYQNKTPARTVLEFFKYRPGKYARNIKTPIYYAICENDTLAPAKKSIEHAKCSKNGKIKLYPCGHFDIYFKDFFEQAITDYILFLESVMNNTKL